MMCHRGVTAISGDVHCKRPVDETARTYMLVSAKDKLL
jgi:hypothetical protein